ncbi:MAG: glycoside hydrolase family 16 protein [Proteobacteria bacterium]|nr:glycoside hydrolase family 16 protein [Pseudomonadota bacterium]
MNRLKTVLAALFATYASTAQAATISPTAPKLSLTGAVKVFAEEFTKMPAWRAGGVQVGDLPKPLNDPTFTWASGYIWNHAIVGTAKPWPPATINFPAWTSNRNANADPNGDMLRRMGTSMGPYALISNDHLQITARPMPGYLLKTVDDQDAPATYMSGSITSFPYAQKYGVFIIRAKLTKGKGTWPAFWLLPASKDWPPEIDVFESLGADPKTIITTVHYEDAYGNHAQKAVATNTGMDLSTEFHNYAVDWGPTNIKWYFDGQLIFSVPTPSSLRQPCYLLANLAIGKSTNWGGAPDASTIFPNSMKIDYIRVYQRPTYK